MGVGESLPVLSKDLFEDVPVLGGCCNHQGAPSGGSGFAVQLLYHGSSAQSTPSSAFTEAPSLTSLTLQPRGLQGHPQMEIPVRSRMYCFRKGQERPDTTYPIARISS